MTLSTDQSILLRLFFQSMTLFVSPLSLKWICLVPPFFLLSLSSITINTVRTINKLEWPCIGRRDWTGVHGSQYMWITRQALDCPRACLRQWMSSPLMSREGIRPTVLLSTSQYHASKYLFLCSLEMCLLMLAQVILSAEGFIANVALMRSHASVDAFMPC